MDIYLFIILLTLAICTIAAFLIAYNYGKEIGKKQAEKSEEENPTGHFYHSFSMLVGELGSDNYETIINVDDKEKGISYCFALKGAKMPERSEEEVKKFFGLN